MALTLPQHENAGYLHPAATTVAVAGSKAMEGLWLIEDGDIVTVTGEIETYRHRNPEGEFQIVAQIAARSPDGIARDPGGTERE